MLDQVLIFSKSGIVLWSKTLCKLQGNPVDEFIGNYVISEKTGQDVAIIGPYALKWNLGSTGHVNLCFVAVYSKQITPLYVDDLLVDLTKAFMFKYKEELQTWIGAMLEFDDEFNSIVREHEKRTLRGESNRPSSPSKGQLGSPVTANDAPSTLPTSPEGRASSGTSTASTSVTPTGADVSATTTMSSSSSSNKKKASSSSGSKKEARKWAGGKVSKKDAASLDRSRPVTSSGDSTGNRSVELEQARATYLPTDDEKPLWELDQEENDRLGHALEAIAAADGPEDGSDSGGGGIWSAFSNSYVGSMIQHVTGGKVLSEDDLDPVLREMREILQTKNVASEIAISICDSVKSALIGRKLESFTKVRSVVLAALRNAVERILTPHSSTDVLRGILDAKAEGRVYTIVFVGVNGVGKSTSLAKVAYYLKEHNISVMLAACDTFRAGAVEQLRTHSRCLDIPLFEMGYSKDPSAVAAAAISRASSDGCDCVLIDTAGRMQNNEPLMKALAKLVGDNDPNLVLFVGEALVGNDGIDQLSMFDKALKNYGRADKMHGIDGIVLTKFDTVDDKVGAALSMSYKSGQPVTFVGTGQKYTHLRKLNVNTVLHHLFA